MAIVTLTTDFGDRDGYVGAMKGVLLSMCPGVTLVDVTHGIPRGDVRCGAFALAQASSLFPPGTVHLAVVDPGVGSERAGVVVTSGEQLFVGPDNGLLSLAASRPRSAWRIERRAFRREPVSATFHGRDVFAPAAARLASGWLPSEAGPAMSEIVDLTAHERSSGAGSTIVLHVDRFGNLVTSLPAAAWGDGTWILERDRTRWRLRAARTYADVAPGELLVYTGSGGQIEIAVRDGSAARRLGIGVGGRVRVRLG
jgi:S-adenosylmethionine hydrolase